MANNIKKIQDPTEAALSAIQDALNIRDDDGPLLGDAAKLGGEESSEPLREGRRRGAEPPVDADLFFEEIAESAAQSGLEPQPRAANDDRQPVGGYMLHSLQQRPTRGPFVIAGVFSFVWLALGLGLMFARYGGSLFAGESGAGIELTVSPPPSSCRSRCSLCWPTCWARPRT